MLGELTAAWPAIAWDAARIEPHVEGAALDGPHRADLLWAWACLAGEPAAVGALERGPLAEARDHLRTLGIAAAAAGEAAQRALTRLVVDGALAGYRGRGPLATFVRTTVVRLAIDDHRRAPVTVDIGELVRSPSPDPELEYMRTLYGSHLAAAVRDAWARIAPHERFLLSLRIYEAMTVDDLAQVYAIHRASAARRAAAARASLIAATRACLRERLVVGDATLDSILRVVSTSVQLPLDDVPGPVHR